MSRTHVEVTRQGWFSRIGGALMGMVVGVVLLPVSAGLLFWNEGRSVHTYRSLKEGAAEVRGVEAGAVAPANENALVHLSGKATTEETLSDDDTGVSAQALRLERKVEMYQWKETSQSEKRNRTGGSSETTTTYSYATTWSDQPISSSSFKERAGHENPDHWQIEGRTFAAERVTLGAFVLGDALKDQIGGAHKMPIDGVPPGLSALGSALNQQGTVYLAESATSSKVGDLRVSYEVTEPAVVSVVARQQGGTLVPHATKAGVDVALLEMGNRSAAEMFQAAQTRNTAIAFLLRFVGFVVMAAGFGLLLRPIRVFADVLPFLGRLTGLATGFVTLLLAGALSSVTIAVAWIAYRPLLGIALLGFAGLAAVGVIVLAAKRRPAAAAA